MLYLRKTETFLMFQPCSKIVLSHSTHWKYTFTGRNCQQSCCNESHLSVQKSFFFQLCKVSQSVKSSAKYFSSLSHVIAISVRQMSASKSYYSGSTLFFLEWGCWIHQASVRYLRALILYLLPTSINKFKKDIF